MLSLFFLFLLLTQRLLGAAVLDRPPAPYLQRTARTHVFTFYYIVVIGWAWINFGRAYRRVLTSSGRRRMIYLMAGATAPALGSFPYLIYGASLMSAHALLFWIASILSALLVGTLLVVMAYAVAFFGVSWPDRVIKARLFKWLLRGPLTASFALGLMTVVRRLGELFWNTPYSGFVPLSVVISILILEHGITLLSPLWERWLFFGADRRELSLFQSLEERFLTEGDLQQFLESILAAARDYLHAPSAFVAILEGTEVKKLLFSGQEILPQAESLDQALQAIQRANGSRFGVLWDGYLLLPLYPVRWQEKPRPDLLLGLLGIAHSPRRTRCPRHRGSPDPGTPVARALPPAATNGHPAATARCGALRKRPVCTFPRASPGGRSDPVGQRGPRPLLGRPQIAKQSPPAFACCPAGPPRT
jgi:hypothetical protein